jgi:hypothetical protein
MRADRSLCAASVTAPLRQAHRYETLRDHPNRNPRVITPGGSSRLETDGLYPRQPVVGAFEKERTPRSMTSYSIGFIPATRMSGRRPSAPNWPWAGRGRR